MAAVPVAVTVAWEVVPVEAVRAAVQAAATAVGARATAAVVATATVVSGEC